MCQGGRFFNRQSTSVALSDIIVYSKTADNHLPQISLEQKQSSYKDRTA
jgi:hypothetical protein